MNASALLPQLDPAFRTIGDVVLALPAHPSDADLILAFARCEGIGYRKGLEAVDGLEKMIYGEEPPEGGGDPNCAHEWNMTAGEADENNISREGPQVILCVKCGCCGDV